MIYVLNLRSRDNMKICCLVHTSNSRLVGVHHSYCHWFRKWVPFSEMLEVQKNELCTSTHLTSTEERSLSYWSVCRESTRSSHGLRHCETPS